jgi:hypothetical protein
VVGVALVVAVAFVIAIAGVSVTAPTGRGCTFAAGAAFTKWAVGSTQYAASSKTSVPIRGSAILGRR